MNIRQLFDADTSTYSYLLWDPATAKAALVDPVKERASRDERLIRELGLDLVYLLETHIHVDHVTGSGILRERFDRAPCIALHRNSGSDCADRLLDDGDSLALGRETIHVLHTPGHTDADVCYLVDGAVLTGDLLLIRSSGRSDALGGDPGAAWDSITDRLFGLTDDTVVYPGHDYNGVTVSTIGEEKTLNPRLGIGHTREQYIELMVGIHLPLSAPTSASVHSNLACGR